nr:hypothetical protein [Kibdelosporangium sp. MJ126-NF4]CEL16805.1 putative DNA-binding protein [Kibdelosporangium sp. MJ126-NF4]
MSILLAPDSQGLLDTTFARASDDVRNRFVEILIPETPTVDSDIQLATTNSNVQLPVIIDGCAALIPVDLTTVGIAGLLDVLAGTKPARSGDVWTVLNQDEREHLAAALEAPRRRLGNSIVEYCNRQLLAYMADDGNQGPAKAMPAVLKLVTVIGQSARDVRPDVRCRLLAVAARSAEFVGWLYRDMHDALRARFWYDRATEWAQEAGDMPMQGYVLLKRSQMAYDERDGVRVLTLAQAAGQGPWRLPAPVAAEVTQQEARGLAMTGERWHVVQQKLELAQRVLLEADDHDPECQLGAYFNEGTWKLRTASCYLDAGKPRLAAQLYGQVLRADLLSRRDRAYFMARMASSLALAGEPDEAAGVGIEAAMLATATASKRTKRELRRALTSLRPWSGRTGPRQLQEVLAH